MLKTIVIIASVCGSLSCINFEYDYGNTEQAIVTKVYSKQQGYLTSYASEKWYSVLEFQDGKKCTFSGKGKINEKVRGAFRYKGDNHLVCRANILKLKELI